MAMLGDLLAQLTDETTALETIMGAGDLKLLAAARELAVADGLDLAAFVPQTVRRCASEASDEEWVALMGPAQPLAGSRHDVPQARPQTCPARVAAGK